MCDGRAVWVDEDQDEGVDWEEPEAVAADVWRQGKLSVGDQSVRTDLGRRC